MISDSNPERRNLVITSVSFIVFCWAGGHLGTSDVRLSVVNVEFHHPGRLVITAWVMLFWFTFRYYVATRGKLMGGLRQDFKHCHNSKLVIDFLKQKLDLPYMELGGFIILRIHFKEFRRWIIDYSLIAEMAPEPGKKRKAPSRLEGQNSCHLYGMEDWLFKLRFLVDVGFSRPTITAVTVPYLLAILATTMGIVRLWPG